jgi:dihydrolipoamide dehydrogenase
LKKLGVQIYKESKATSLKRNNDGTMDIEVITKTGKEILKADKLLLSIGKRATTAGLNLDRIGVQTDKGGFILIDKQCRTNIPNIYAVGDCTGMPFLAHRATKQGIVAAEAIAGHASEMDFRAIPGAIFTDPEIAFAGLSEDDARKAGYEVKIGRASFGASGRALTHLNELGYVKIIADAKTDVILGMEIIGPDASDLISEAALVLEMGATLEDIAHTVHPHPTLPEMLMEAAEAALGKAIHIINQKKAE